MEKCWMPQKDKNPYHHGTWQNNKKGLRAQIISDIGFGKQRNVIISNYRKQTLSGFKIVKVGYFGDQAEAWKFAKSYMKKHGC